MSDGASSNPLAEVDYFFLKEGEPTKWGVVRFNASEGLSELYEFVAVIAGDPTDKVDDLVGKVVALDLSRLILDRYFAGVVVAAEDQGLTADKRVGEVRVVPHLWLLSQRTNHRIFQDVDALEIVRSILKDAGIYQDGETFRDDTRGTYPKREYCVQYGETDLAFVSRLLEDEGVTYYFEHTGDGEKLVLTDFVSDGGLVQVETMDGGAVPAMGTGGATNNVESVRRFDWVTETRATGVTLRDYNFTQPDATVSGLTNTVGDGGPGKADASRNVYESPGRHTINEYDKGMHVYKKHDGPRLARARFDAQVATEKHGRGASNVTGLQPGKWFNLTGHGRADLDRKYTVTKVHHHGHTPDAIALTGTDVELEVDRYANHFECIPNPLVWRPPLLTSRPRALSPQTAAVVAEPGSSEEICTDFYGRVLVLFHWDRPDARTGAQKGKQDSCWIHVAQTWAAANWGFVFTPRVGMEVIVHFVDGNPDRPLVTGCVYNGRNHPPLDLPLHKTQSVIKTWSSPTNGGYNELRFEDLADKEEIYIRAQKDMRELVLNDHFINVKRHRQETVEGHEWINVKRERLTHLESNEAKQVEGNQQTTVHGSTGATLHVDQKYQVTADEGVTIESGASKIVITPSSITLTSPLITIQGGLVKINC